MLLAINYLKERKFIYRYLKPENIIVIENENKINKFWNFKYNRRQNINNNRNTTLDIIRSKFWKRIFISNFNYNSIHAFIYEGVPFGKDADDPMKIYISIMKDNLELPKK